MSVGQIGASRELCFHASKHRRGSKWRLAVAASFHSSAAADLVLTPDADVLGAGGQFRFDELLIQHGWCFGARATTTGSFTTSTSRPLPLLSIAASSPSLSLPAFGPVILRVPTGRRTGSWTLSRTNTRSEAKNENGNSKMSEQTLRK